MILNEEATISDAQLPLAAFKAHLRLGTGFAEDAVQDPVLKSFLLAAMAAIEARIGKALIAREFSWGVNRWRNAQHEALPLAPVQQILRVALVDAAGHENQLPSQSVTLQRDAARPMAVAATGRFPAIPKGGQAVFHFIAGYGASWDEVPADLAQAVFLLAAHYYEYRDETALARGCMPFGVQTLIERYRPVRLFGGERP